MKTAALATFITLTLTSCATAISGVPSSPLADPARIGGVSIAAVDSGMRPDAPSPTVDVLGTDHGRIDRLGAAAVEDVEAFWSGVVLPGGGGEYQPVSGVTSWDARTGAGVTVCKRDPTVNAAFCGDDRSIGWDRGHLMPVLVDGMGDLGAVLVLAHEVGHAVDAQTRRVRPETIVGEQRADCYAGAYMAWVASGESPRFQVDSSGLDLMLEALPVVADSPDGGDHGNAVERLWAFQQGFMRGADSCSAIDMDVVQGHRDGVPPSSGDANATFTPELVDAIAASVTAVTGVQPDTSSIDIDALNDMSAQPAPGVRGDGTGGAALIAVLVQPWVSEQQVHSPRATACAVGAVARGMASGDGDVTLSAGDLDEMVLEILTVGRGATNRDGDMPMSGFERVRGFLDGVYSGLEVCAG